MWIPTPDTERWGHRGGESVQNKTRDRARQKKKQMQRDTLKNRLLKTRTQ